MPLQPDSKAGLLLRPFQRFFQLESASGILLLLSAVASLVWANSPWAASYVTLWELNLTIGAGELVLDMSVHHWINDGLMAVFFFVVGLEIKREVLLGELASPKKAALTVAAAFGGMLVPASIYSAINVGGAGASGWGIPMATDIAFALGVLALLGKRVPLSLKVFVTAIAIVDDLGAVVVIALFYTAQISWAALAVGAVTLVALVLINRVGIRWITPYVLLGIILWLALLESGVHATIAGVLLAGAIPARGRIDAPEFLRRAQIYLAEFAEDVRPGLSEPTEDQRDALHALEAAAEAIESPLVKLEHGLHPMIAFFIMPVFALANAGVSLHGEVSAMVMNPVTIGVLAGLFVGKQIGILVASWLAVRVGLAVLPAEMRWRDVWGVGLLGGIGFTMSLFIANLAFADAASIDAAKVGILAASLLSGVAGTIVLARRPGRVASPSFE
jgi:Na+:H+ antiporter, NhaA family